MKELWFSIFEIHEATLVANDLIQINAFVSEQRYCELGSKSGSG